MAYVDSEAVYVEDEFERHGGVASVPMVAQMLDLDPSYVREWAREEGLGRVGPAFVFTLDDALELLRCAREEDEQEDDEDSDDEDSDDEDSDDEDSDDEDSDDEDSDDEDSDDEDSDDEDSDDEDSDDEDSDDEDSDDEDSDDEEDDEW